VNEELLEKIKLIAPGTMLRKAIDDIMRANTGALIVLIDDPDKYKNIIQGGFRLNINFEPEFLYELSKMDGAIVVSSDISKIYYANVHLVPDPSIPTTETGMRHRTAERFAKQTGDVVITVSRRRKTITLFYKNYKYVVNDITLVLSKVSQAINTLEKYRKNFDKLLSELDIIELENRTTLYDVVKVLEKGIMVMKISYEIKPYLTELGEEARLAKMQVNELTEDIDDLLELIIMDYYNYEEEKEDDPKIILENLVKSPTVDSIKIARSLGYSVQTSSQIEDITVKSKGFRILKYIAKIPMSISRKVIDNFKNIVAISQASIEDLKSVEGIGNKRAKSIVDSIHSLKMRKTAAMEGEEMQ